MVLLLVLAVELVLVHELLQLAFAWHSSNPMEEGRDQKGGIVLLPSWYYTLLVEG